MAVVVLPYEPEDQNEPAQVTFTSPDLLRLDPSHLRSLIDGIADPIANDEATAEQADAYLISGWLTRLRDS